MDAYVKTVLTVIAACLLLQVAQGFGLAGTPGPGKTESTSAERYVVQAIPRARVLLRFDQVTGQTWTMPLQPQGEKFWTPVDEAPSEATVREQAEDAPAPPDEAGATQK
jgi:hypothetical protein